MGIRVLLMGVEKPLGSEGTNSGEVLCVANSFVPLFWLLPFKASDLKQMPLQDDIASDYPVLSVSKNVAVARVECFLSLLSEQLEPEALDVLQRWHSYLQEIAYPELAVDTYELWVEQPDIGDLLRKQLDGLEDANFVKIEEVVTSFEGVTTTKGILAGDAISLAGFGW